MSEETQNLTKIIENQGRLIEKSLDVQEKRNKEEKKNNKFNRIFKTGLMAYLLVGALVFTTPLYMPFFDKGNHDQHLALVEIKGEISATSRLGSYKAISEPVRAAFEDEDAVAIVLQINSPGGSPVEANRVYKEILRLKALYNKPVYAIVDDLAASAGYFIACAADLILVDEFSLVGSIGVVSGGFGFTEIMEKVGVERRSYTAGAHKGFLDPFTPENPEEIQHMQSILDSSHQRFIDIVKESRGPKLDSEADLFNGLVWGGNDAIELGLADAIGDSESVARDNHNDLDVINVGRKESGLSKIFRSIGVSLSSGMVDGVTLNGTMTTNLMN